MRLDGDRLVDPALKRAIRLGEHDAKLVRALQKPCDFAQLQTIAGDDAARRLTALARLYLLAGPRCDARLALHGEQVAKAHGAALHWPSGRQPPQHGCVGTGTCCSASFLGPIYDADAQRVNALNFGRSRRFPPGSAPFESVAFRGQTVRGMARDANGRCVTQGDDGLCEIHAAHGLAAKPVTCRQFPLRFHASPDGIQVSLLLACDGYDRARSAAAAWPQREAEIRQLLDAGAVAVLVHLPVTLAAGLPIAWTDWQVLRTQLFAAEPEVADPWTWLDRALLLADAALVSRQSALAEGPDIAWTSDLQQLRQGLRAPDLLWPDSVRVDAMAALRATAQRIDEPRRARDRERLLLLADGLAALDAHLPLTPDARLHLNDIVSNDLTVQVVLGELDAGLGNLTRRLLLAHGVAAALAHRAGRAQIDSRDTTQALHVVYRSEPELTWLGQLQVAQRPPVP